MKNFIFHMLRYCLLISFVLIASQANAVRESFSIESGTLGPGFSYAVKVPFYQSGIQTFNLRFSVNINEYTLDSDITVVNPDLGAEQITTSQDYLTKSFVAALLDWHPYNNGFRVTFGIAKNDSQYIQKTAYDNANVSIGDTNLTNAYLNVVSKTYHDNAIAPYLGIGYGHNMKAKRKVSFNFSLGVLKQNDPDQSYEVSGYNIQSNIQTEYNASISDTEKAKNVSFEAAKKTDEGKFVTDSYVPHISAGVEVRF